MCYIAVLFGFHSSSFIIKKMLLTIIGLGLIGGSMALDLRKRGFAHTLIGVDTNPEHCLKALQLNIVDLILPLQAAVAQADVVILAVPVQFTQQLLPLVLDYIPPHAVVTDVGSTKQAIIQAVVNHPKRGNYVASHPMAGTEYSGPEAAIYDLFDDKVSILCNIEQSNPTAVDCVKALYNCLNMPIVYMNAAEHDMHVAYVSHISHISSFVLATTVLEKEQQVDTIFDLASGGFASTVRLAKSSPQMWAPIFTQNAEHITQVLDTYIQHLQNWRTHIANKDYAALEQIMTNANQIKRILDTPPAQRIKSCGDVAM